MKRGVFWLLLLTTTSGLTAETAGDIQATTAQGEAVVLHADGTWESASIDKALRLDLKGLTTWSDVKVSILLACRVTEVLGGNLLVVEIDSPPYVLSSRETVRLLGTTASAPESLDPHSYESYRYLRDQTLGKIVYLGFDRQLRHDDGVLLSYLYTEQGVCLNALMLERGLVRFESEDPSHFDDEFGQLEISGQQQKVGIWSGRVSKVHIKALFRGQEHRYVELANSRGSGESIGGWRLMDSAGQSVSLPHTTLQPSKTVSIYSGTGTHRPPESYIVDGPQMWQGTRDSVSLYDADGVLVDRLIYPAAP